jgi:hypothetical protein
MSNPERSVESSAMSKEDSVVGTESAANPSTRAVPDHAGARDILIFRGAEYWPTPEDVIREVHEQGLSVRIPRNNIPANLVKGLSRIALGHIKAVMVIEKGTEDDLRSAFEAVAQAEGHDPKIDLVLGRNYEHRPSRWLEMPGCDAKKEIFERLGVSFKPGIFAYCYWSGSTYYLKPEETEAPEDLAAKGVHAVRGVIAETGGLVQPAGDPVSGEVDDAAA